jgi:enamine deaminase RidA (YjgF/YER057c/UK114 family)
MMSARENPAAAQTPATRDKQERHGVKPLVIHPEGWAKALGYANGMLMPDGTLHIGGQIGWTKDKVFVAKDFVGQMEQALANIAEIVRAAGGEVSDIGRLTWFVKDKAEYLTRQKEVGEAYRRVFGKHFPAMSMLVIKDLVEDEALIEIEGTAYIQPRN